MAGNIKGITIEFSGDTTKLDQSLRNVNKETAALDRELKNVDRALKFNPNNVDLWRQKQQLLTQKISETQSKLELLKAKQKDMDARGVDKNSKAYRDLQREIITTESKLKTFKAQLRAIGNVNLKALGGKFQAVGGQVQAVGGKIKSAGQAMRGFSRAGAVVVALMGALVKKSAQWADDINTMSKQYSMSTKQLQLYAAAAKLVDVDVETIAKSHVKLTKSMKSAADGSDKYTEAFKELGVEVTNSDGSLRDADEVWQEVISSLGEMTNETERDALAMQLMGKNATELNPLIEDGGDTYKKVAETMKKYGLDFIDEDTLRKANEFNDQIDTIKMIGIVAFQQLGTALASYLVPSMEKVVNWVGQFANWLSTLDPQIVATVAAIASVVAVLAPLLIIIGSVISAVGTIISFVGGIISGIGTLVSLISTIGPAIGAAIAAIPGIGWIIAAIAAIIAIGILLWKNWDKVKAKAIEVAKAVQKAWNDLKTRVITTVNALKNTVIILWNALKSAVVSRATALKNGVINAFNGVRSRAASIFNAVKNAIAHPIQTAVGLVRAAINKIKGILSGRLSFPKIKLPHFKLTGKFSLDPPQVPKLSISWYKNGGIFNKATLAGIGEAGPEAVIPLDTLWSKLDKIAAASQGGTTVNVYAAPGMDATAIANEVQRVLVRNQRQRQKAWGY